MAEIDDPPVLDDETWAWGERYWRDVVDEILASVGGPDDWPKWPSGFYGDGATPLPREYQSICAGRSWHLDRAFSIEQVPLIEAEATITVYVKDYAAGLLDFPDIEDDEAADRWFVEVPADDRVPRSSLMISLTFSEATAASAQSLLAVWLRPETTVAEMEAVIERTPNVSHW